MSTEDQMTIDERHKYLRSLFWPGIDYLFSLPNAIEGQTENVLETLAFPLRRRPKITSVFEQGFPKEKSEVISGQVLSFYEKGADAPVTFSFDLTRSFSQRIQREARTWQEGSEERKKTAAGSPSSPALSCSKPNTV